MSIKTLAHVCIMSADLGRTTDFYCGALGLRRMFSFTKKGEIIGFYLEVSGSTFIEVFGAADAEESKRKPRLNHFCLETDSMETLRTTLADRGYSPGDIKLGKDGSHQFWVKDPDGVSVEFHQYTKESSQFTGRDVEVDW